MVSLIDGLFNFIMFFPGTVIHEIAHRFFCDIFNVPVFHITYFHPFSKVSGCVIHEPINDLKKRFFIGIGPLFFNSILCVLLLFPFFAKAQLSTSFLPYSSVLMHIFHSLIIWCGASIGFAAVPSNKDVEDFQELTKTKSIFTRALIYITTKFIHCMNAARAGFILRIAYVCLISHLFASFILSYI